MDLVQGVAADDSKYAASSSVALLAALAWVGYFILIGGSGAGLLTPVAIINAVIGAFASALWIKQMLRGSDLADRLLLGSLLLALGACVLSTMPRASLTAAMSYLAFVSLLGLARRQLSNERTRRLLVVLLAALGTVLVVVTLAVWATQWLQWMTSHGGIPPLDLALSNLGIYWFKYQLAILIGMLIPSLIGARKAGIPDWLVWLPIVLCGFAVIASGSRSAWLGGLAMVLVLAAPRIKFPSTSRAWVLPGVGIVLVAALLWQTGMLPTFLDRALAGSTVSLRGAIWTDAIGQFVRHPLSGSGPGTFATTITTSGYFQHFARVGMGPDSAPVEIVSESGVLGVSAVLLLALSIAAGLRDSASPYRRLGLAALAMFVVSSLTNDTVHSAEHVGLAALFVGLACPASNRRNAVIAHRRPVLKAGVAFVGALVLTYVAALQVAAALHMSAIAQAELGESASAVRGLEQATALDPANGLYWRELALGRLALHDVEGSARAFEIATGLSPGDMAAQRGLAITRAELRQDSEALGASERASVLKPTDPMNLVTEAYVAALVDNSGQEERALREALQVAPWLPGAVTWQSTFGSGVSLDTLYGQAAIDIGPSDAADNRTLAQRVWLFTIAKRSIYPAPLGLAAIQSLLGCDQFQASVQIHSLNRMPDVGQWDIVAQNMFLRLAGDHAGLQAATAVGLLRDPDTAVLGLTSFPAESPFVDRSEDWRIYRYIEPTMPVPPLLLPSSQEALSRWMRSPVEAAQTAAPGLPLGTCHFS